MRKPTRQICLPAEKASITALQLRENLLCGAYPVASYHCMSCRLGHETRHFNVGSYRRKQRGEAEIQDASLFDHKCKV